VRDLSVGLNGGVADEAVGEKDQILLQALKRS